MLLIFVSSQYVFAGEWNKSRDFTVDQELSEMKNASIILPPGKHEGGTLQPKTGQTPGMSPSDAGATAKASHLGISGAAANLGNSGTTSSDNSETASSGGGLSGNANLDAGTESLEGTGATVDADLNLGTGGTGDSTENVLPNSDTSLSEETPTVGADISGEGDYLISADASVGDTCVSADLIP